MPAKLYPAHCAIGDEDVSIQAGPERFRTKKGVKSFATAVAETRQEATDTITALMDFGPDLLIVDPWCLGMLDYYLLHFGTRIPIILINSSLVMPFRATDPVGNMVSKFGIPTLFQCLREFDFPRDDLNNLPHSYVGPSIDLRRPEVDFDWSRLHATKPLIYCSFGSQSHRFKGARRLLQKIILALSSDESAQAVIAVGKYFDPASFRGVGPSVILTDYAPQLGMLKKATMMITHGGLGAIKECIYFGVPMLVFPFDTDQPANAARVNFHAIGLAGDTHGASVEQIRESVAKVRKDKSYRRRLAIMSEKLKALESSSSAVEIINDTLRRTRAGVG